MLSLIGGIIGLVMAKLIGFIVTVYLLPTVIPWYAAVIAIGVMRDGGYFSRIISSMASSKARILSRPFGRTSKMKVLTGSFYENFKMAWDTLLNHKLRSFFDNLWRCCRRRGRHADVFGH